MQVQRRPLAAKKHVFTPEFSAGSAARDDLLDLGLLLACRTACASRRRAWAARRTTAASRRNQQDDYSWRSWTTSPRTIGSAKGH